MRFSIFFALAAAITSGFAQTVAQVEADITNISNQVTALDTAINSFPATGGTIPNALAIHNAANNLKSTIDDATAHVEATPASAVSESDGQTIFNSVNTFVPTIQDTLTQIVAKKPALQGLPLTGVLGIVKQDLSNLNTSTGNFATALIAKAPADLASQATALRDQLNSAFATALAAYADS